MQYEEALAKEEEKLQYDAIEEAVKKVDSHFEKLVSLRQPLEKQWEDLILMALEGTDGSRTNQLVRDYVNLANPYFPSIWRQSNAHSLGWINDGKWLDLVSRDSGVIDTALINTVQESMRQKLNSNHSGFNCAIEMMDLQARLLNTSAINYCYLVKTKQSRRRAIEIQDGKQRIKMVDGPETLEYQGARADFVHMLNCYPDVLSPKNSLINQVDLYLKEPVGMHQLKDNPKYDDEQQYEFQDFVIFRSCKGLSKIENPVFNPSQSLKSLDSKINKSSSEHPTKKGYVELRRVFLEEFKIERGRNKEIHENVVVYYAKSEDMVVPLLIEYCHRPFDRKEVLVFQPQKNPWGFYSKSQLGLSYNQACWLNYIKAAQAYQIGKTTFPTRFIPDKLYYASQKLGVPREDIDMALRGAGYDVPFALDEYNQGANGIFSPEDRNVVRDIQIYDGEIARAQADISNINIDLQNANVSNSTAAGVEFVDKKQTALYKQYLRNLADDILEPFCELFLEDYVNLLYEETITSDVKTEDLQGMFDDFNHVKNVFKQTGQRILQEKIVSMGEDGFPITMGMEINPVLEKQYVQLNKYLAQYINAKVEIKIEGNEVFREERRRDNLELMNMIQSMNGQGSGKEQAGMLVMNEYLDLHTTEYRQEFKKLIASSQQESEMVQQKEKMDLQAQMMQAQADTELKAATSQEKVAKANESLANAQEEQSRADKQNLENQMTIAALGG